MGYKLLYEQYRLRKNLTTAVWFNPLTTNVDYGCHSTLAPCYQLAQSGSVLAERVGQGEVGGCHPLGDSAWQLLQLAVEMPFLAPGWSFFSSLHKKQV